MGPGYGLLYGTVKNTSRTRGGSICFSPSSSRISVIRPMRLTWVYQSSFWSTVRDTCGLLRMWRSRMRPKSMFSRTRPSSSQRYQVAVDTGCPSERIVVITAGFGRRSMATALSGSGGFDNGFSLSRSGWQARASARRSSLDAFLARDSVSRQPTWSADLRTRAGQADGPSLGRGVLPGCAGGGARRQLARAAAQLEQGQYERGQGDDHDHLDCGGHAGQWLARKCLSCARAAQDGGDHGEHHGAADLKAGVQQPGGQSLLVLGDPVGGLRVHRGKGQCEADAEQQHGGQHEVGVGHRGPGAQEPAVAEDEREESE